MSYATFLFYIPLLVVLYIWALHKNLQDKNFHQRIRYMLSLSNLSLIAFITPLIIGCIFVTNRNVLLSDPVTGRGIFRGGVTLTLTQPHFINNFSSIIQDFFISGKSYYFELFKADFSDYYPIIALLVVMLISIIMVIRNKSYRLPILCIWGMILGTYILISMTSDSTNLLGMRRNTPILTGIYALFILTWYYVTHISWRSQLLRNIVYGLYMLLCIHNLLVFPTNFSHLHDNSVYDYQFIPGKSPTESLSILVQQTKKHDLDLTCKKSDCRYQEVYSAVAGYCVWNKLSCHNIYGYDYQTENTILLSPEIWNTYMFSH